MLPGFPDQKKVLPHNALKCIGQQAQTAVRGTEPDTHDPQNNRVSESGESPRCDFVTSDNSTGSIAVAEIRSIIGRFDVTEQRAILESILAGLGQPPD